MNPMKNIPSAEVLEASHDFPCVYQIRVIGSAENGFVERVIQQTAELLGSPESVDHSVRNTPGGRHVAIALNASVEHAEQVRSIYERLGDVEGIVYIF